MFKKTTEYKEVLETLETEGLSNAIFNFECYSDGMVTYSNTSNGYMLEVNIICDDADYFAKEPISDLLDIKGITYFHIKSYNKSDEISIQWSFNKISGLN